MSTRQLPAGLGIDVSQHSLSSDNYGPSETRMLHPPPSTFDGRAHGSWFSSLAAASVIAMPASASETAMLRSARGMQGLLKAESGEAMVEFDVEAHGSGSCFKDGRRIALDATPQPGDGLPRLDTILNFGAAPAKSSAELRSLLGNANARLKPGASVPPAPGQSSREKKSGSARGETVSLEQAKPRARVEVDIILQSNACVQGADLRGQIKLRVRKRAKKEAPILLADGKVRIIGFEYIPSGDDRHTFYQCAAPLSAITGGLQGVYDSPADPEGFAEAVEGVHVLPFSMHLPVDAALGNAKGVLSLHSGVAVRYIAMVSIKVKDTQTGKRSIAHFYRNCEIWPRLNSATVLAPAPRALQASTARSLSMLNSNSKVKLTALLPRLVWVAGQRCYVRVSVANETKKTVKTLALTLIRTVTTFRPRPALDAGRAVSIDPDACQTSTSHKAVAETVLEMSQRSGKGHASAKGWWTGVGPGEELDFSHYILLPAEALSIVRARLLEVEYSVRVTLSAGPLTPDVSVTLPVRVINFLSIDPPPNVPALAPSGSRARRAKRRRSIDGELSRAGSALSSSTWSNSELSHAEVPAVPNLVARDDSCAYASLSVTSSAPERNHYAGPVRRPSDLRVTNPDSYSSAGSSPPSDDDSSVYSADPRSRALVTGRSADSLGECSVSGVRLECLGSTQSNDIQGDTGEEGDFVFASAHLDESDADADSPPGDARRRRALTVGSSGSYASRTSVQRPTGPRWTSSEDIERGRKRYPGSGPGRGDVHVRRREDPESSRRQAFALRVQEKLASVAATSQTCAEIGDEEMTPRLDVEPDPNALATEATLDAMTLLPTERTAAVSAQEIHRPGRLPLPKTGGTYSIPSSPEFEAGTFEYPAESISAYTPTSSKNSSVACARPRTFTTTTVDDPPPRPPRARRPTDGILQTGTSTNSVQGRIAELEERVRSAQVYV
ncbi:hypothetical protein B0H21DRAFT_818862 [Amylocystis lapponica]|nr:hypothetical protein B0H21DRAFT_818862 [Amylocystis lapponica]